MSQHIEQMVLVDQSTAELEGSDVSNPDGEIQNPFDPNKIRVDPKNTQMDSLIKRMRNNEIDLSPNFQRNDNVWTPTAQSRLIESMLIKIPLPAFYLDATDDGKWLVVDGLQRLTAIKKFVVDKTLILEGMEFLPNLNGKKFNDVHRRFQRRIEETDIVMYLIQPGTPPQAKFDIFKRINTGGVPLSGQEIRHALNQGKITELLKELAESNEFKRATDNGIQSKRMDDRDCVLRFFAFMLHPPEDYSADSFDRFLNETMAQANAMDDEQLNELAQKFRRAMESAREIFGNVAFRKRLDKGAPRHPINKTLFE
ncbi:MAG: DUF262 domain-containing protein, partial [Salinispira sp.]